MKAVVQTGTHGASSVAISEVESPRFSRRRWKLRRKKYRCYHMTS